MSGLVDAGHSRDKVIPTVLLHVMQVKNILLPRYVYNGHSLLLTCYRRTTSFYLLYVYKDTHIRYTVSRQAMAKHKARTKTPRGQEQRHVNGYARVPARASKMAHQCANMAATRILYLCKEAVIRITPCFKSSNCITEAIHRSSWPIRYCLEKSNQTHTHPTTVTLWRMRAEG